MFKRLMSLVAVAFVSVMVLAACGSPDTEIEAMAEATRIPVEGAPTMPDMAERPEDPDPEEPAVAEEPPTDVEAPPSENGEVATEFTIEGFDIGWRYEDQDTDEEDVVVTIPAGEDVTIILPNVGVTLHDFVIDELGIEVDMPAGETVEAVIPADTAPGEYEFHCSIPGHAAAGMVGTLIVSEEAPTAPPADAPDATPEDAATPEPDATPPTDVAEVPDTAPATEVTIEGYDIGWRYEDQDTSDTDVVVTIPAGQDVTITLPNVGVTLHDFVIDELDIEVDMPPGETLEVVIPADTAPGEYEFYCSIPGHRPAGMVGTLVIE